MRIRLALTWRCWKVGNLGTPALVNSKYLKVITLPTGGGFSRSQSEKPLPTLNLIPFRSRHNNAPIRPLCFPDPSWWPYTKPSSSTKVLTVGFRCSQLCCAMNCGSKNAAQVGGMNDKAILFGFVGCEFAGINVRTEMLEGRESWDSRLGQLKVFESYHTTNRRRVLTLPI